MAPAGDAHDGALTAPRALKATPMKCAVGHATMHVDMLCKPASAVVTCREAVAIRCHTRSCYPHGRSLVARTQVLIDGYQFIRPTGTGMASYVNTLAATLKACGCSVSVLFGQPLKADPRMSPGPATAAVFTARWLKASASMLSSKMAPGAWPRNWQLVSCQNPAG